MSAGNFCVYSAKVVPIYGNYLSWSSMTARVFMCWSAALVMCLSQAPPSSTRSSLHIWTVMNWVCMPSTFPPPQVHSSCCRKLLTMMAVLFVFFPRGGVDMYKTQNRLNSNTITENKGLFKTPKVSSRLKTTFNHPSTFIGNIIRSKIAHKRFNGSQNACNLNQ